MLKIIFSATALKHLQDAVAWYDSQQKGVGKELAETIDKLIKVIQQNPKAFPIRYEQIRKASLKPLKRFPFLIHYSVKEDIQAIYIVAILHTSRGPDSWEE